MAYLPRKELIWDGAIFHVTWQCHNKSWLLKKDWTKKLYYDLLLSYKERFQVEIYSYNFMENHIHLTGRIKGTREEFSALFRIINSQFARKINKHYQRSGQVIQDRFSSPVIESDAKLLKVMGYQDLNDYHVGKVKDPRENKWSSYHYYAFGKEDPMITAAPSYIALEDTPKKRQSRYQEMVKILIEEARKENYSKTLYIGDPDWVNKNYQRVRQSRREKSVAYLQRQQKVLYQSSD